MGVDHSQRDHALLSASGANRWLNCPPSARLEDKQKQTTRSVFAQEGTLAHEFADVMLRHKADMIDSVVYNAEVRRIKSDELYSEEMDEYVKVFVDIVLESLYEAKKNTKDSILLVEERLDFSNIVPQGFGTGDASIISDHTVEVIDFKYGKGVKVDAEENPQLMLYGIGALNRYDLAYDIEKVKLTIVQPRLDHYSTYTVTRDDLLDWAENKVKPIADLAFKGDGEKKAGEWCKFCKVKALCKAYADKNLELAKHEFRDPSQLTLEQLAGINTQIPMLLDWAKSVENYLLKKATEGTDIPGHKLVEGRSNRKWRDEQETKAFLLEHYDEELIVKKRLAGITDIEKLIGRSNFHSMMGEFVIKPPGKPTLVPKDDPRPAMGIESAKEDFKN